MKKILFATSDSISPTILRGLLGLVIFAHGAQKLLGWFGGYGFTGTMDFFTGTVGLAWIIGFLVILLESFGAIALLVGFGSRIIAISFIALAVGIVATSHIHNGFFMNWFGTQKGEGYEFFILMIAIALSIVITGSGKLSIDKLIVKDGHGK